MAKGVKFFMFSFRSLVAGFKDTVTLLCRIKDIVTPSLQNQRHCYAFSDEVLSASSRPSSLRLRGEFVLYSWKGFSVFIFHTRFSPF